MTSAKITHAAVQGELRGLIRNHFVAKSSSCPVLTTPDVAPHMQDRSNMRIPDLAVRCSEPQVEQPTLTDPMLLIEILSPSNETGIWSNIWTYSTVPRLREIVVVYSLGIDAEVLRRHPDGTWPQEPETTLGGVLILESIGLRAPIAHIYRTTPLRRPSGR